MDVEGKFFHEAEEMDSRHMSRKQKNLLTIFTLISFFGLGMVRGQEGVVFLDLLIIIRKNLETGSLLFLFSSVGSIIGALVGGILYDRFDALVVFTCCVLFMGLLSFAIPFCESFGLMGVMLLCRSLFSGAMDSGGTFMFVQLWRLAANPYIQALHFVFGIGALAVPFVTEPFLAPGAKAINNSIYSSVTWNTTLNTNSVPVLGNNGNTTVTLFNDGDNTSTFANNIQLPQRTDVYISFLVVGGFIMITVTPFLSQIILRAKDSNFKRRDDSGRSMTKCTREERLEDSTKTPVVYRVAMYVLIVILYGSYGCVEKGCAAFLMPFAVEYLHWDKIKGAHLLACFWGSFAASRFLGIFVAKITTEFKMLVVDYVLLMGGFCLLLLTALETEVVVWCAAVIIGLAQAGIFPTAAAWINRHVARVTGVISGILIVSLAGGTMIHLPLLGFLFQEYSPASFIYLSIGFALLCSLSFVGLVLLSKSSMRPLIWS